MKKILVSFMFIFICSLSTTAFANSFQDIENGSELHAATTDLQQHGIISGYADGTFKPNNTLTRSQLAKMIATSLKLPVPETTVAFSDVKPSSASFDYIQALVAKNIVSGFPDGTFKPNAVVTRAQAAKMIAAAYNIPNYNATLPFTDVSVNTERYTHVQAVYFNGIAGGTSATTFGPTNNVTRGQAALFIYRAWQLQKGATIREVTLDNSNSAEVIYQQGSFFKVVTDRSKIRVLPLSNGTGYLFIKGDADEHYALYEVKVANKKATLTIVEWYEFADIQFNYYTFDSLQFQQPLQSIMIRNANGDLISSDQYFFDYNAQGLELAMLSPGKYTLTLTSTTGEQKTYTLFATFSKLTLQTKIYL